MPALTKPEQVTYPSVLSFCWNARLNWICNEIRYFNGIVYFMKKTNTAWFLIRKEHSCSGEVTLKWTCLTFNSQSDRSHAGGSACKALMSVSAKVQCFRKHWRKKPLVCRLDSCLNVKVADTVGCINLRQLVEILLFCIYLEY